MVDEVLDTSLEHDSSDVECDGHPNHGCDYIQEVDEHHAEKKTIGMGIHEST